MKTATITEAKNGLSALIDRVRAGESILILDRGRPVARLEPAVQVDDPQGRLARTPSTAGSNVTSWSAWDGAKWHVEGFGLGWRLDSSNHSLGNSAGGVGAKSVTVHGRQGFSYQGAFDPTGTLFYNTYDSWLEGKPGMTFGQCVLQIVWRRGFVGWSTQAWCGSGTYS